LKRLFSDNPSKKTTTKKQKSRTFGHFLKIEVWGFGTKSSVESDKK
jgi:hypothetical protein